MTNILNYLRNVFLDLKLETRQNSTFVPILLVLLSIPLSYAVNSIAVAVLLATAVLTFKKSNFSFNGELIFPILMYLLMLLSQLWTIDAESTRQSLLKEIPLLLIPLAFIIAKDFSAGQKKKLISYYSYGILLYAIFYLVKAAIRFAMTNDSGVFFYHELVTKDVNAVHVSVYMAVAFFYFFRKSIKSAFDYFAVVLLLLMVFLLSSKNIIIAFVGVIVIYYMFYAKLSKRMRMRNLAIFILFLVSLSFVGKIRDRFIIEYETNMADRTVNDVINNDDAKVYNVSIKQAWTQDRFEQNDFFPGTAFRVYQFRIFTELVRENDIFFTGFGLNASYPKIAEKGLEYNVFTGNAATNFEGYQSKNFHNQYVQNFAELGIFGFLLLMLMLLANLRTALTTKDLTHFAFAFLMISLFLTESFLWRQRGVVFFTMMYCLYNSATIAKPARIE